MGEVFYEVYQRMKEGDVRRPVPIIDSERRVLGVLSLLQLMDLIFRDDSDPLMARTVHTSLGKVRDILGGHFNMNCNPTSSMN
jgi:manganese-dependent inorganic pyrophosphatase